VSALITIADIENALGRGVEDEEEESGWQFIIDSLSAFINNFVDVSFEPYEDVTVRYKSDYYGQVKLIQPVTGISSIKNFRTQEEDFYIDWDGIDTIFYGCPEQVVDVTYSFGYSEVPADVKLLMVAGVLGQINEQSPVNLRSFQVGDVVEQYRDDFMTQLFGNMATVTLYKYTNHSYTINVAGSDRFPDYRSTQAYLADFD